MPKLNQDDAALLVQETLRQLSGESTKIKKAATYTTGTGLVQYDLQAPAKNLYPVTTPISKALPRVRGDGGTGTHWNSVTAIVGSGFDAMGWVPEGGRSANMGVTVTPNYAAYKTLGEEGSVSFEAVQAANGYEDLKATNMRRALQKLMLKQENAFIGGNATLALGTAPTPTLAAGGTGATLLAATYSVYVIAATHEGYYNWYNTGASLTSGITQSQTINGLDGKTYTLNGGYGQKGTNATQAVTLGQTLTASISPIAGAFAYFWYVGTAGSETLQAVTNTATASFAAPLTGGNQAFSSLAGSGDYSTNSTYAFNGLLAIGATANSGSYFKQLANGATLTASGRGSINEIDTMLQNMYTNYQVSPDVLYVGPQVYKNMLDKILNVGGSAPLVRFNLDAMGNAPTPTAGQALGVYVNPFQNDGALTIPIKIHPFLPPGTVLGWTEHLPLQFESNEVPNVAEVHYQQDYTAYDWPLVTREYRYGVYVREVLAVYFNPGIGIITNITAG